MPTIAYGSVGDLGHGHLSAAWDMGHANHLCSADAYVFRAPYGSVDKRLGYMKPLPTAAYGSVGDIGHGHLSAAWDMGHANHMYL